MDKPRHFILVYTQLSLGGIETLILRMTEWLIREGHRVTLVLTGHGELDASLPKGVTVIYAKRPIRDYCSEGCVRQEFGWLAAQGADVIYSFCFRSAFLALWLATGLKWPACPVFLTGLYHPHDALLVGGGKRTWMFPLVRDLYRNRIPPNRVLFMNEACRRSNGLDLGVSFDDSQLFPIPVSAAIAERCERRPVRNRIVSVGRLAAFKTYNLMMPEMLKDLVARGHDVSWDVYGGGELAAGMREKAAACGVANRCRFFPVVPYEKLAAVYAESGVFVGMGTAAIEAGLCGVPTIVIPAYSREPLCGGWWHETAGYWVGEDLGGPALSTPALSLLEKVLPLSPDAYEDLCAKEAAKSRGFLTEKIMPRFLEVSASLGRTEIRYPRFHRLVYRFLTALAAMKNRHA